jgi:hypothetical protein
VEHQQQQPYSLEMYILEQQRPVLKLLKQTVLLAAFILQEVQW